MWLRIDDKLPRHPKVAGLSDRDFRTWLRVLCYCAEYRTRGALPASAMNEVVGLTRPALATFRAAGLVQDEPEKGETPLEGALGYVHDFNYYNDPNGGAAAVERKRRQRDKSRDDSVTSAVTDAVTEPGPDRDSRVGTRARPVPSLEDQEQQQYVPRETPREPAGGHAAAAVDQDLKNLRWTPAQRAYARDEPDRARAWIARARTHADRNPGGYAWAGFISGEWPEEENDMANGKPIRPAYDVVKDLIVNGGHNYTDDALNDEMDAQARERNSPIDQAQRDELLELARTLRQPAAATKEP